MFYLNCNLDFCQKLSMKNYIGIFYFSYINREFPSENKNCIYSIPKFFIQHGQEQASNAEKEVHTRLCGIQIRPEDNDGYWQVCFQGACYAGRSFRNDRKGKLMMREHDFVVFIKYKG